MPIHTFDLPFLVGEKAWRVGPAHVKRMVRCPDCLGTKKVTIILATSESFLLDCKRCTLGFSGPSGVIEEWVFDAQPTPFYCSAIASISVKNNRLVPEYAENSDGTGRLMEPKDLYKTEEECRLACEAHTKEAREQHDKSELYRLHQKRGDLCGNLSHWRRRLVDLDKERARLVGWINKLEERNRGEYEDGHPPDVDPSKEL
jgi:hypothetical protein